MPNIFSFIVFSNIYLYITIYTKNEFRNMFVRAEIRLNELRIIAMELDNVCCASQRITSVNAAYNMSECNV